MRAFFDDRQWAHDPKHFVSSGQLTANPEQPKRIEILSQGAKEANCKFETPKDFGMGPISDIHSPRYLTFLQTVHTRWQRSVHSKSEVVPSIHPLSRGDSYPASAIGQAGFHQADTSCPIGADTWKSAYWSAQSAINLGAHMLDGAQSGYALCRPPGHHAFAEVAGGFCFLNNSAILARYLTKRGARIAILDVDVHHGNGTQGIFYDRDDVFTVSLHADPSRFYPFYWGQANETGKGRGSGFNLNLALPRKTGDDDYLVYLKTALSQIETFCPDILVVALGLDAAESDPFEGLSITTEGFSRIATSIAKLRKPLAVVQEGGYLGPDLGMNLRSFLQALED